jgi:cytokinesis protein
LDNRTAAEEKLALEKRRRAAEEAKASRKKAAEEATAQEAEETAALDNLLEKLRNGDNVGRRTRRARPSAASTREPMLPLPDKDKDLPPISALGGTTADIARGMLEQLKTNGFVSETFAPLSPSVAPSAPRRRRLRTGNLAAAFAAELEAAGNPMGSPPESPGIRQELFSAGLGTYEDGSDTGRED